MVNMDTIAAISTAPGDGAIGIIRISGSEAFAIAEKIFAGKKKFNNIPSHTVNYGKIINPYNNGEIVDEVLLLKMEKPKSFTTEDVVEIHCHGGTVVLKKILEIVLKAGARIAEPGEFTKRAFLNGRIDLSQAEAIIDIINAKTDRSSKAAVEQLEGKLSRIVKDIRKKLIELIAHIEVNVDYPEYDVEQLTERIIYERATEIKNDLVKLLSSYDKGRVIREGANVVITGRPNAGKSSLFNELSGKSRAIVTDIPGTTRDIIDDYINLNGIPVRLIDTAGIRETEDVIEKIGVQRAQDALEKADIIILMIDATAGITKDDLSLLEEISDKKLIIVINKIDLLDKQKPDDDLQKIISGRKSVEISVKKGIGINELESEIEKMLLKDAAGNENDIIITNVRHKNHVDKALDSTNEALSAIENGIPLDCALIDIRNAAEYLGMITGESISEDVANEIFEKFCIGK